MELKEPKRKRRVRISLQQPFPILMNSTNRALWQVYTGRYSGDFVVVDSPDEMAALHNMGFFGKGSLSRGGPEFGKERQGVPPFIRQRQFDQRQKWAAQQEDMIEQFRRQAECNISTRKEEEDEKMDVDQEDDDKKDEEISVVDDSDKNEDDSRKKDNEVKIVDAIDKDEEICVVSTDEKEASVVDEDVCVVETSQKLAMKSGDCTKKDKEIKVVGHTEKDEIQLDDSVEKDDEISIVDSTGKDEINVDDNIKKDKEVSMVGNTDKDEEICVVSTNEKEKETSVVDEDVCVVETSQKVAMKSSDSTKKDKEVKVVDHTEKDEIQLDDSVEKDDEISVVDSTEKDEIDVDDNIKKDKEVSDKGKEICADQNEIKSDSDGKKDEESSVVDKNKEKSNDGNETKRGATVENDEIINTDVKENVRKKDNERRVKRKRDSQALTNEKRLLLVLPDSDEEDQENYLARINPKLEEDPFPVQESLHLTLEESFFLSFGLGCLHVIDLFGNLLSLDGMWQLFCKSQKDFVQRYVAYHYFRSKGWVVKPGIKFGGDFLLYKQGPPFYHASYIVLLDTVDGSTLQRVPAPRQTLTWTRLMGLNRLAESAGKEVILCQIIWPTTVKRDELNFPSVLSKFQVHEVLIRRWISSQEREENDAA